MPKKRLRKKTGLLPSRLYCRFWNLTKSAAFAGRGLYRRWGIAPRPEERYLFVR